MESHDAKNPAGQRQQPVLPKTIVCLYEYLDEQCYRELQAYLSVREKNGSIQLLGSGEISPGLHIKNTLLEFIKQADVILLLISADFLASADFLDPASKEYHEALEQALEQALTERERRGVPVVPILVRPCLWEDSKCGELPVLPRNEKPIVEWEQREQAYKYICDDLVRLIPGLSLLPAPRIFQAEELRDYVPRPKVFDEIKRLLLSRQGGQSIAIRGAGGFGKTTMALALCHDPEIQAAFPDGILWVNLGEQPPRTLDTLNRLLTSLDPLHKEAITLDGALDRWKAVLRRMVCLLVIDDVWQAEALKHLIEVGPKCVCLITTRNEQLLREDIARIFIDAMEEQEALAVLSRGLSEEARQPAYQTRLARLAEHLGRWPLLLTLAHGLLTKLVEYNQSELVKYNQSLEKALDTVEQEYRNLGVMAFRRDDEEARKQTAEACLEVSLRHLADFTDARILAHERYQELAVFPEDTEIPLIEVQRFWQATGGLESSETAVLCICLHRLSLLLSCNLGNDGKIRLHNVLSNYLKQRARPQMTNLQTRFLNAYWQKLHLKRWADLPENYHYLWQYLIWHLCRTGHTNALVSTLTDLWYLTHKVLYVGVAALEGDLLLACMQEETETGVAASSSFASLHRAIVRISHLLHQATTGAEIGGLLLSHLGTHPSFANQKTVFERELPRPFITAWLPLPGSSSALHRTFNHTSEVMGCAMSPDGSFIVSACYDGTLKVWDAITSKERFTLSGHTIGVAGCAVSPDGSFIVSACYDGTLKVWDVATKKERFTLFGHRDGVMDCAVYPNGHFIVSASADGTLKIWDAITGKERFTLFSYTGAVMGCAVSPDSHLIVSACLNGTVKVWDATTGAECFTLSGHKDAVMGCVVSPDGSFIVSASRDKTLKVWDVSTRTERFTLSGHTGEVTGCAVSPDSRLIVSSSNDMIRREDETIKMWDAATGKVLFTLSGHTKGVTGCAVSSDGRLIVSSSSDGTLKVWDITAGAETSTRSGYTDGVRRWDGTKGCAVSPDGRWIVSTDSWDGTYKIWDASTGAECFALSSLLGTLNTFKVWDTTGREHFTLSGRKHEIIDYDISSDGRFIISASSDDTFKVKVWNIWDILTGKKRFTLSDRAREITNCVVSPDNRFIVCSCSNGTFRVCDITARWPITARMKAFTLPGHVGEITSYVMSPDSRFIVSASSDGTLKVWDIVTGVEPFTLSDQMRKIKSCVVSPDSRFIVSVCLADTTLQVWDWDATAGTGKERCTLSGHIDRIEGCAVSPDSRFIVSVSWDKTLKVWESWTGRCVLTFPVDGELFGCAFYPDGERLVACGGQGLYFLRLVK